LTLCHVAGLFEGLQQRMVQFLALGGLEKLILVLLELHLLTGQGRFRIRRKGGGHGVLHPVLVNGQTYQCGDLVLQGGVLVGQGRVGSMTEAGSSSPMASSGVEGARPRDVGHRRKLSFHALRLHPYFPLRLRDIVGRRAPLFVVRMPCSAKRSVAIDDLPFRGAGRAAALAEPLKSSSSKGGRRGK
jgi:hypothetical protein